MADMIERVAMALAADMEDGFPRYTQQRWDQLSALAQAAHRQRARVAVEAMKITDTAEGVPGGIAFEDAFFGSDETVFHAMAAGWNATIDAALSPLPVSLEE